MPRKQTTEYSKETEKETVSLQLKENWSYSMLMETLGIQSEIGLWADTKRMGAEYRVYCNERCLQHKLGDLSSVDYREQIAAQTSF